MKKFLIVLAMVVTASLLMGAGCFTVNTPPIITTLALPDATVGTAYTATVEATDADGDALTFSVGGPTGMVISGAGVISGWTPTEFGTETVIVAVTDGTDLVSANFIITVEATPAVPVAVTGVTLDEATLALTVGDAAVTLVATVAPATATDTSVIWASSEETVAIVALGVVTPLNAGISAITATTVDGGFVATCVVTVTAADEEEPVLPDSVTPVIEKIANVGDLATDPGIISLYSSDTQYMNADEVDDGILVMGVAPKYSEINVYVDDEVVGTSTAYGLLEYFIVFVAEDDLGDDGAKTIYATATELGLDESANSTEYAFTLDTVVPEIVSVAAEAEGFDEGDKATLTITFNEKIDEDSIDYDSCRALWDITVFEGGLEIENPIYVPATDAFDLVSAKVLEMETKLYDPEDQITEFALVRLGYDFTDPWLGGDIDDSEDLIFITDLAGNKLLDSVDYCYLELED